MSATDAANVHADAVRTVPHFLNGALVTATEGRFADVFNPSTGAVAARVPLADTAEVDAAVATA
ncbi:methylmalonate-semialdehyde dehydrogenase (CoA acylating), partial [Streptomyces sp. SID10244]|nr:methylmalonate-semialdehyde dehydrogenase (CoA acylating) [Streptomyces sp. SID10244]